MLDYLLAMSSLSPRHAELLAAADPAVLGARLRAAREAKGWRQAEVAGDSLSVGYVSRIERGQRRATPAVLVALGERLGIGIDDLVRDEQVEAAQELRLGLSYVELALESGQALEAESQVRDHLARARNLGNAELVRQARLLLARALEAGGDLESAIIELEDLLDGPMTPALVEIGIALCRCYRQVGDLALATGVGDRLGPRLAEAGLEGTDEAVRLVMTVAMAHIEQGNLSRAERMCRTAMERAEEMGSPAARAATYWNSSIVLFERGEVAGALALARRALALLGEGKDTRNLARLRLQLGRLQFELSPERPAEAIEYAQQGRDELAWSSASAAEIAQGDVLIAELLLKMGAADQAADLAEVAAEALTASPVGHAEAGLVQGAAQAAVGDVDGARRSLDLVARSLGRAEPGDRRAAQVWFELADVLESLGDHERAHEALRDAGLSSGLRRRTATPRTTVVRGG